MVMQDFQRRKISILLWRMRLQDLLNELVRMNRNEVVGEVEVVEVAQEVEVELLEEVEMPSLEILQRRDDLKRTMIESTVIMVEGEEVEVGLEVDEVDQEGDHREAQEERRNNVLVKAEGIESCQLYILVASSFPSGRDCVD
jgi:hypothetical protein